jgi:hypothetical protein
VLGVVAAARRSSTLVPVGDGLDGEVPPLPVRLHAPLSAATIAMETHVLNVGRSSQVE